MTSAWYGSAQSSRTNVRRYNTQRTLTRVAGTEHLVRAIYGSSDHAEGDHTNSPLCRTAPTVSSTYTSNPQNYSGGAYKPNGYVGRASVMHTLTTIPEGPAEGQAFDLEALLTRAAHHGLSLVEYAAKIGLDLSCG